MRSMEGEGDLLDVCTHPRGKSPIYVNALYHTMDIPGYGHVDGEWDLRGADRRAGLLKGQK